MATAAHARKTPKSGPPAIVDQEVIRRMYAAGYSQNTIALAVGSSQPYVCQVIGKQRKAAEHLATAATASTNATGSGE